MKTKKDIRRKCILENIHSGRVIKAKSISDFCRKAGLVKNAKCHISPILDGERASYCGWYIPSYLHTRVSLKDIYGNKYQSVEIKEVLKRKITSTHAIRTLVSGNKKSINKLALAETDFNSQVYQKNYKITKYSFKKDGVIIEGNKLSDVAKKLDVHGSNLYPLIYGYRDNIGDISLNSLKVENKRVIQKIKLK